MKKNPVDTLHPWEGKAVLLVDLDAFFASVEQLDHPEWKGKPVIVGGDPARRGVVSTASYEARAYGVHSAMPSSTAHKLCPDAIWAPGNFHRYREVSQRVMDILYSKSPHLLQVSIDEAFLDISPTRINTRHPVCVARDIQAEVDELGITCSIGLGTSKAVAKIASDMEKPHGLTVVYPGEEKSFLHPLPIGKMSGIGPVAQRKLQQYGIYTLGDLARSDDALLRRVFGKNASLMKDRSNGIDLPVDETYVPAKSVSNEISIAQSTSDIQELHALIATMAHKVGRRLRKKNLVGNTLHLKIRFEDLHIKTTQKRSHTLGTNDLAWLKDLYRMLDDIYDGSQPVRLVGVGVSGFDNEPAQARLFEDDNLGISEETTASPLMSSTKDTAELLAASDRIAERFGEDALRFGHELRSYRNTTGSSAKNPEDYKD